jgi:succinate dehydrogenase / fumarate reductase, membrane anchor subunit
MQPNAPLRTPLKRARGLGSAHSGTHHFWVQRVSAIALIPLSVWFVTALIMRLIGADQAALADRLSHPLVALALGALLVALFVHARLGVQVIIEDYVHCEAMKLGFLIVLNFVVFGLLAASLMAVAKLHFA